MGDVSTSYAVLSVTFGVLLGAGIGLVVSIRRIARRERDLASGRDPGDLV